MRGRPWWRGDRESDLCTRIRSLLKQHGSGQAAADAEGISRGTFSRWCRIAGVSPHHLGAYSDEELHSLVVELGGIRETARHLGVSPRTAWLACKKRGITWRPTYGSGRRFSKLRGFSDEDLLALYRSCGYSASELARRTRVAKSAVIREMDARKLPRIRTWAEAKKVPEAYAAWCERIDRRRKEKRDAREA